MPRTFLHDTPDMGTMAAVARISCFKEALVGVMKLGDSRGTMDHGILSSEMKFDTGGPQGYKHSPAGARNLLVDKDRITDITQRPT